MGLRNAFAVCRPVARFSCRGQASFSSCTNCFTWVLHVFMMCNRRCDKRCQCITASHLLLPLPTQHRMGGPISGSGLSRSIVKLDLVASISVGYPRRASLYAPIPVWLGSRQRYQDFALGAHRTIESESDRTTLAHGIPVDPSGSQWIPVRRIRTLQELANTVWTYARLCFLHEDLMVGIADRLMVLR